MATKATAKTDDTTTKNTVVPLNIQPPAEMMDELAASAGEGVSSLQEDNLIPILSILQGLSPEVKPRDPKYIDGAQAGDFCIKSLHRTWSGESGFGFQPCYFSKDFIEWIPRDSGGGYVARHTGMPEIAKEIIDDRNPSKKKWQMPNGNEIIETRYHFGFLVDPDTGERIACVMPLASTGHTFSRGWMAQMNQVRLPNGNVAPSRACIYNIKSNIRRNVSGEWFTPQAERRPGWVTLDELRQGKALHDSVASGERKADIPDDIGQHPADADEATSVI